MLLEDISGMDPFHRNYTPSILASLLVAIACSISDTAPIAAL